MLWFADRYGADKVLAAGALATWLQTKIDDSNPCPPLFLWNYNELEGHESEKGWRYDSQHYTAMNRWKAGTSGYIRFIQELPYDVTNAEPAAPASNWSSAGGAVRQSDAYPSNPPARRITFISAGTTYDLHDGTNLNIRPATVTTDGASKTAVVQWDIFDVTNTNRLLTLQSTLAPAGLTNAYKYKGPSVTAVTEQNTITGIATSLPMAH
jgi:hypothetical protein